MLIKDIKLDTNNITLSNLNQSKSAIENTSSYDDLLSLKHKYTTQQQQSLLNETQKESCILFLDKLIPIQSDHKEESQSSFNDNTRTMHQYSNFYQMVI
jgi:hypothetical protein